MEWLDLVAPSAAILGLFAAVGLIIVAVRQGRAIRRLEERLARQGEAATPAPLQRIAELQARQKVSSGAPSLERQLRMVGVIVIVALVIVLAIGGIWYLFVRDDGGSGASASEPAAVTTRSTGTSANPPDPVDTTLVPDNVPPLDDPGQYTVAVFNASGITGVARTVVAPTLQNEGFQVPISLVANPPDGATDRPESVVMWSKGNKRVAWNVAKLLGIKRAPPIDGYTPEQVGNADAVVLVGRDLAPGATSTTP
jgi:hypothetical protein